MPQQTEVNKTNTLEKRSDENKKSPKKENQIPNLLNDNNQTQGFAEISQGEYFFSLPDLVMCVLAQSPVETIVALSMVNKTLYHFINTRQTPNVKIYTILNKLEEDMQNDDQAAIYHYIYDPLNLLNKENNLNNIPETVEENHDQASRVADIFNNFLTGGLRAGFAAMMNYGRDTLVNAIQSQTNSNDTEPDLEAANHALDNEAKESDHTNDSKLRDGSYRGTYADVILASKSKRKYLRVDETVQQALTQIANERSELTNPYRGSMIAAIVIASLSGVSAVIAPLVIQAGCPYDTKTRTTEKFDSHTNQYVNDTQTYKDYHCSQDVMNHQFGPALGTTLPVAFASAGLAIYFSRKRRERDLENIDHHQRLNNREDNFLNTGKRLLRETNLFVFSSSKNNATQIQQARQNATTRGVRFFGGVRFSEGSSATPKEALKLSLVRLSQPSTAI